LVGSIIWGSTSTAMPAARVTGLADCKVRIKGELIRRVMLWPAEESSEAAALAISRPRAESVKFGSRP
jgi:hypothetical protein